MVYIRWKALGPIMLSALSLFLSFCVIQAICFYTSPSFSLLDSHGAGKIIFTTMVVLNILLLLLTQSRMVVQTWLNTNIKFLKKRSWVTPFLSLTCIFFGAHFLMLGIYYALGYMAYNASWGFLSFSLIIKICFGFIVTFFLAWSEELIFRGTIYPLLTQQLSKRESIVITSFIFMICHDLANPLNLITCNWKLGLGLFLLGILLNTVFAITEQLYVSMGIHAGLVAVKVLLRRAPFLLFIPLESLPWWLHPDLRQSFVTHLLFFILAVLLMIIFHQRLSSSSKQTSSCRQLL